VTSQGRESRRREALRQERAEAKRRHVQERRKRYEGRLTSPECRCDPGRGLVCLLHHARAKGDITATRMAGGRSRRKRWKREQEPELGVNVAPVEDVLLPETEGSSS